MSSLTPMLGALFIGVVLASSLYGVTSLQTYIYFTRHSNDTKTLKSIVFFLWIINTLRIAILAVAGYTYMVMDFTHPAAVLVPSWTIFPSTVLLVGLNNTLIRVVFCYRIWRLGGKYWWIAPAVVFGVATFGLTLAFSIVAHGFKTWGQLELPEASWMLTAPFAMGMVADIFISTSLSVLLAKRKTGYARSDSVVQRLIIYAINNAILSTMCGMLVLVTYLTAPSNFAFMCLYIVYPELILNALLATLNGRPSLKNMMSGVAERRATADTLPANSRDGDSANSGAHIVELRYLDSTMSAEETRVHTEKREGSDKAPGHLAV
ncbi:hypothetical protein BC628DRAFT_1192913 [Trametes gibbosa]|nr:hypothetical protein BC628DRAFT_1192913 [Trametes gibbosa]